MNVSSFQRHKVAKSFYELKSYSLKTTFTTERVKVREITRKQNPKIPEVEKDATDPRIIVDGNVITHLLSMEMRSEFVKKMFNITNMQVRCAVQKKDVK